LTDRLRSRFFLVDPLPGSVALPLSRTRYLYALSNPTRYTDPLGLSATTTNGNSLTASLSISCGKTCSMIVGNLINNLASALRTLGQIVVSGANSNVSVSPTSVGSTAVSMTSSLVVNPDTVTALLQSKDAGPIIKSAAGLLDQNYDASELQNAVVEVCNSNGAGAALCAERGDGLVRQAIIESAREQGITSSKVTN